MLDDYRVKFCGREFECVDYGFEKNENIEVVIRPEDIKMVDADKGMLKGLVTSVVLKVFIMKWLYKRTKTLGLYTVQRWQKKEAC